MKIPHLFLIPSRTGYYIGKSYLGEIDVEVLRDKIILAVENPDLMDSYWEQRYHFAREKLFYPAVLAFWKKILPS